MTDETLSPIFKTKVATKPLGRKADLIASVLAGLGAGLSILTALWFFLGFAENDTRPEHLTSAFVLTLGLFAFAILPFAIVSHFAWGAYRQTVKRPHLLWTLLLMLPWVGLGALSLSYTPLPVWSGLIVTIIAALLSLWALISLTLDRKVPPEHTDITSK